VALGKGKSGGEPPHSETLARGTGRLAWPWGADCGTVLARLRPPLPQCEFV